MREDSLIKLLIVVIVGFFIIFLIKFLFFRFGMGHVVGCCRCHRFF